MKIRKRISPRTPPWGTPGVTSVHLEHDPLITSLCCLFDKNSLTHSSNCPVIPYFLAFILIFFVLSCQKITVI